MNKKRISILLCLALVISMLGSPDQSSMAKKKVPKLNKKKVALYVGKSVRLKVKGTSKKAKWKSSSKKVATVSSKGVVKAKRKGKAKITATVGKKKLVCQVTVKMKNEPVTVTEKPNDIEQQKTDGTKTVAPTVSATEQPQPTADGNGQAGTETDKPQSTAGGDDSTASPEPTGPTICRTPPPGWFGDGDDPTASPEPTGPTICRTPPPGWYDEDDPTASPKPTAAGKETEAPATDIPQPTVVAGEVEEPLPLVPTIGQASFDDGTDGFTAQGNASIQIANGGYEGNCLQISNRKTASDGVVYSAGEKVTAGESYTVQGYVKTASGAGTLKCMYRTGDGQDDIHELVAVSASGDGWTKFMGTLTVPDGFEKLDIWYELEGSTETFYIDEVNILQIISIKDTFDHIFWKTGTCIRPDQMRDPEIMAYVRKHYSSITLENDMKPDALMPGWLAPIDTKTARAKTGDYVISDDYKEDTIPNLNYSTVDEMLRIAKQNGLKLRYHVLLWHAQTPEWFFKQNYSQDENAAYVSEQTMNARMEMYIRSVIHHVYTVDGGAYRDVVYAWDVANEYFSNTPDKNWSAVYGNREGKWGNHPAFIKRAFELAHDELEKLSLADSVSLFYNDFNTYMTTDNIIDMIHYFNMDKKVCSGVGMQSHIGVDFPSVDSYVNTVRRFIEEGFEVQITELDVACVDTKKPEAEQDIPALYEVQAKHVKELTEKLVELQRSTGYRVTGLTWWGMYDGMSWVKASHALMFHNELNDAKPSYFAFMDAAASAMNKPAPTPPPLLKYDFSDEDSYGIEGQDKVSHVLNQDGSITLTFRGGGAYDFFLPKSEWDGVDYKSIVLTYTSEGGNLCHALYDANAVGKEDLSKGKHPYWSGQIKNTQGEEKKLILNVTDDCIGKCIRGLQIFTQSENVTITIKSMLFCGKENPTKYDLDPSLNPPVKPTSVPTVAPTAAPTVTPTAVSTATPTPVPTVASTVPPIPVPTAVSTAAPTPVPTAAPTPVVTVTVAPTSIPTTTPNATSATDTPQPTVAAGDIEEPLPLVPTIGQASFDNGTGGFTAQGNASIQIANDGYEGNCLQISNRDTASDGVVYAAGEEVTAGESYTVQGYVKTASGAGTLTCMYRTGDGQDDIHELVAVSASGDGWTKFMGTLTVPDGFEKLDIWFELEGSTETFYLDEVNILQIISIKDTFDHIFWKTGTCIRPDQMRDPEIMAYVRKHYSSITLENDMKPDALMPGWLAPIDTKTARAKTGDYVIPDDYQEDKIPNLNYSTVDEMLRIAKENGLKLRYHVLLWHAQTPEWFFKENYSQNENAAYVSEQTMNARMEMYIRSVIHHVYTVNGGAYRDVVYAWDVANEYFSNTPDKNWSAVYGNREGKWGNHPAFIKRAFELAHDELEKLSLADSVSLFYNDFNTYLTTDKIIDMIHYINSDGKVCSGVGMQSHIGVDSPSIDSYINAVQRFIEEGFEVQITELDVACVNDKKPEAEQDIPALYEKQAEHIKELTEKLVELQRSTGYRITGLTWWGMYDGMSWVGGSHALMFHDELNDAKPSYFAFMDAAASEMNKPAPTPPPLLKYDFSDEDSYGIEGPNQVSHVLNEDGSITITFRGGGAYDFFLPKSEWDGVDYKSIVLTYTSEGGNLNHALYDVNAVGKEDLSKGKHPYWSGQIKNTQGEEKKLILNVTNDCIGKCIRGLQIFTQSENVTITIKSMIFCGKANPTKYDLDPSLNPPVKPTPVPTVAPTAAPTVTPTAVPTVTPTPLVTVTVPPTATPKATPKYTPPAETAPPVLNIDFTAEGAYHNESPAGADVVTNDDGSITITFKNQFAAFNFYLPDTAQNYYSKYTSVTLTYTSKGGNLGHALYDAEMQGTDKTDAGKHPDWGQKITESETENTLTFDVTSKCVGGCIRGFQIFNPHDLKDGKTITITVKSIIFNAEPEEEETEEPWTPLDATNLSGGEKTDNGVVLNNIDQVTIPLPNLGELINGSKVEVTVSGILTEESTGFRVWLAEGGNTASDQYHYTKSNGVGFSGKGDGDLTYKAGAFTITAVLTVGNNPNETDPKTDTADKLLIKAPRYDQKLNGVTITDIQVRNADNSPYKWVTTWGTAEEKCDITENAMPQLALENTTVREIIRVTTGGEKLRLRLSNQYGDSDVEVKSLHLAKQVKADESTIDTSTDTAVTVNGSEEFVIPKGKVIVTDPVDFSVDALDNVAVSAYFGATPTRNITGHRGARATTYQVTGNCVSEKTFTGAKTTTSWFFLADASIWSLKKSKAVVCFGDSITDGYGTDAGYLGKKPDSYTRWIDYFAKRLQANESTKHISLINEGIGSNSILGAYPTDAGKDRFARDLLEHDGVGYCIILFGVNDLNKLENTSKYDQLLPEYQKMVKLCHDNGIKVYGAPILPFGTSDYYSDASEEVRTMINNWMRSTDSQMDGIIDFESAVADPANPKNVLEAYTHSDGLHPYDGYEAMANAIDLSLFE